MGREGMFVKFCGMTRVEDAQHAARLGANAVGFIFSESPRQVAPGDAAEIAARLHPSIRKVGVFVDAGIDQVSAIVGSAGLDGVQLHGSEDESFISDLRRRLGDIFIIKALRPATVAQAFEQADVILIDPKDPSRPEQTSQPIDPSVLEGLDRDRFVLAGGLTPGNVAEIVTKVRPWGVDVSSGVEVSPGIKDPSLMKSFIHEVRKAEGMTRHPSLH